MDRINEEYQHSKSINPYIYITISMRVYDKQYKENMKVEYMF